MNWTKSVKWKPFLNGLILLILLNSCLPLPIHNTYYKPSSERGKLFSGVCSDTVGPYNIMRYLHSGIDLQVWAYREQETSAFVTLIIKLELPAEKTVEIASKFAEVRVENRIDQYEFTEMESSNYGDDVSKNRTIPFQKRISGRPFSVHVLKCRFPLSADSFSVKVPSMLIDGKQIDFGIIHFIKTSEWILTPVNC